MGKIANRQSLVFSECCQLWQAIPEFHVEGMLHEVMPLAQFGLVFGEGKNMTANKR